MTGLGVRRLAVALCAAGSALLVAGCDDGVPEPAATPTPEGVSAETPEPTRTPTPTSTVEAVDAELAELRASDRFLELAEHERAATATWARFGWEAFAPFVDGEQLFEWSNKAELWDEVAPPFRDECLLAGPEATRPMWDAEVVIPAGAGARWNDESTQGRGQFMELVCMYEDSTSNEPVERWAAVLIATDDDLAGRVVAEMDPFEVREADYPDFDTATEGITDQLWEWVVEQPAIDGVGEVP